MQGTVHPHRHRDLALSRLSRFWPLRSVGETHKSSSRLNSSKVCSFVGLKKPLPEEKGVVLPYATSTFFSQKKSPAKLPSTRSYIHFPHKSLSNRRFILFLLPDECSIAELLSILKKNLTIHFCSVKILKKIGQST